MRRTYLPTLRQKIVLFTLTRPNYSIFEQYGITLIFPVHQSIFPFLTLDNSTWRILDSHKRCYSIYTFKYNYSAQEPKPSKAVSKPSIPTEGTDHIAKRAPGRAFCLLYFILTLLCSPGKETICQHCGRDFKVLGRHVWRCKARIFTDQPTAPPNNHMVTTQETVGPL